ncbi:MAG: putative glycoside hydrolase, partial [Candidatus Margulisbacteria bacterium]|nr:putative glycoside hydrolase [Candidatus Margulisiibacteriota bacterium]
MKRCLTLLPLSLLLFSVLSLSPQPQMIKEFARDKRVSERGIYVTAYVAQLPRRFNELKERCKAAGLNTMVIDAKEIISQPYLQLAREHKLTAETKATPSPWLSRLAAELHKDNFILTARIVVFKDDHLALARPDLGVHVGSGLYRDRKGGKWLDPYADEVRLYNALIAETAALSGVDEVQFDYIRFPAEGESHNAYYPHAKEGVSKVDIICDFLADVKKRIEPYSTSLAVDIFGVTAWQSRVDIDNLGQDLERMGKYLDVLSPMLYPSHFHAGYDGFAQPGAEPYYFVNTGVKQAREILSDEATVLVPWIQGFNMLSPNFGPEYIRQQVKACEDEGVKGFLIWNARNDY